MRCEERHIWSVSTLSFQCFLGVWVNVGSWKHIATVLRVQLLLLETIWHVKITYIRDHQHINTPVCTTLQPGKNIEGQSEGLFKKNTLKHSICAYTLYVCILSLFCFSVSVSNKSHWILPFNSKMNVWKCHFLLTHYSKTILKMLMTQDFCTAVYKTFTYNNARSKTLFFCLFVFVEMLILCFLTKKSVIWVINLH